MKTENENNNNIQYQQNYHRQGSKDIMMTEQYNYNDDRGKSMDRLLYL